MRQVDVRVINPAARFQSRVSVAEKPWRLTETAVFFALLCAFWGVVLFLALEAAVR